MSDQLAPIRRQEHGIKGQSITVTLPATQAERVRREASAQGISVSRHIVALIELAWSIRDRLSVIGDDERRAS